MGRRDGSRDPLLAAMEELRDECLALVLAEQHERAYCLDEGLIEHDDAIARRSSLPGAR